MKKKITIGINVVVALILLALAIFCFIKFDEKKDIGENGSGSGSGATTAITTELTTETETGTETTTTETTTETTNVTTDSSTTETTLTETVATSAETTTTTVIETTNETTVETTSTSEVVSTVFSDTIIIENLKETTAAPNPTPIAVGKTFVKTFTRGTYYAYGGPRKGGSGRQLINCATGGQGVKGSIASWYLYKKFGYNYKGKRTKVYLEIEGYSKMNGWYYLDDSCAPGYNNVIDFFYINGKSCPFSKRGVVKVKCYI